MTEIQAWLLNQQDLKYGGFNSKLMPTLDGERVIGVRTPVLRKYAKQLIREGKADAFLRQLPHRYFEEDQLHAFILSEEKDYETLMKNLEIFLPYVNNWATCDQLRPKVLKKHTDELQKAVNRWLESNLTYTVRFGIGMLNSYYLDEKFEKKYLYQAAAVESSEYYVNMMLAWYFATALTKQYEATIPLIEGKTLDKWVHNKSIQKARESRQIPQEIKDYLYTLKK